MQSMGILTFACEKTNEKRARTRWRRNGILKSASQFLTRKNISK